MNPLLSFKVAWGLGFCEKMTFSLCDTGSKLCSVVSSCVLQYVNNYRALQFLQG